MRYFGVGAIISFGIIFGSVLVHDTMKLKASIVEMELAVTERNLAATQLNFAITEMELMMCAAIEDHNE